MSHIVVVVDKPFVAYTIHPHISRLHPGHGVLYVMTGIQGLMSFAYPRGLGMKDYPFVGEPEWRARREAGDESSFDWPNSLIAFEAVSNAKGRRITSSAFVAVAEADRILFAGDADRTSVLNFDNILDFVFLPDRSDMPTVDVFRIDTLFDDSLRRAFSRPGTLEDPWFVETLHAGRLRRFFEYSYDVNSLALIDRELRKVIPDAAGGQISKVTLQLLYHIRRNEDLNEAELHQDMATWKGTGRYPQVGLGSITSRATVIERLVDLELVDLTPNVPRRRQKFKISDLGSAFLDRLHPGCEDVDMLARLSAWEMDWRTSRPRIERYIRTFFGRQKRFASQLS